MKEMFIEKRFNSAARVLIAKCNEILADYERQGYDLSLRQLYYQLVAANIIENSEREYKNLGAMVSDARLAGLIDWDMISDRGRVTRTQPHWDSPADIIDSAASSFRLDKWLEQPAYVVVMVEKQALEGVLIPVCEDLDIPFCANKGYSSSSALYATGKLLSHKAAEEKALHVIYLGDHDPSGIDMSRDVHERLELFSGCTVELHRVALNMPQIKKLRPPENPAKLTDSRADGYIRKFGHSSWELDAIKPDALAKLVRDEVFSIRDADLWEAECERERVMRGRLEKMAVSYRKKHGDE